jgi:hypothetical protein
MIKNNLRYSFEEIPAAKEQSYQVRLNGVFVMYVNAKNSSLVDSILEGEYGFKSRQEVYDYLTMFHERKVVSIKEARRIKDLKS